MSKIQADKLAAYQRNAWPAMLDDLAQQLGVKRSALELLQIGYAPGVEFKKGMNFQGWWVVPERDAFGVPVGLSLRGQSGFKCMYPGSNHGLTYAVNPDHEQGQPLYRPGKHNWVRTMDAGVDCPVCGKPDGCLLSRENPEDPKAVICIRTSEGSVKREGLGWLHIRKDDGPKAGTSVLYDSNLPVLIVEGMSDVATAMSLGFVAVGRPSNLAGLDLLRDVVRGRDVVVIGENDEINKQTGRSPGQEGMVATFQFIKGVTASVRQVMPPPHIKDLRSWYQNGQLEADGLMEHIEKCALTEQEETVLPNGEPSTMAYAFLDARFRMAGRYTLRSANDTFVLYDGTKYKTAVESEDLCGPIYQWAAGKYVTTTNAKGDESVHPLHCDRGTVGNLIHALNWPCPIREPVIPCWINGAKGPDPKELIPFTNGLLWVSAYLAGRPESEYLLPRTPDFFSYFSLPYAFDETATAPDLIPWLRSTLPEQGKRKLLQEWFGYSLMADNSRAKMMMFLGPTRSGKSTALDMIRSLLGPGQCASPSLSTLGNQFGLQDLVGKQALLMGDVRVGQRSDTVRAAEVILSITGQDAIQVERKNRDALEDHKFICKITMATNEMPHLPDHSGALKARILVINFDKSFEGHEDIGMRGRLISQAPGVILWALQGYKRLIAQRGFTLPDDMANTLQDFREITSPTASFVEECCEQSSTFTSDLDKLFDAWSSWAKERGIRTGVKGQFGNRLRSNVKQYGSRTRMHLGHKVTTCTGVRLQRWAEKNLLGRV